MTEYQQKWQQLRQEGKDLYCLRGTQLLLEVMPEEETMLGTTDIVIYQDKNQVHGSSEANSGVMAIVLDCGQGYWDAGADAYIPLDLQPGNIVLLPRYSVQYYSKFPGFPSHTENKIALCLESEVKFYYRDMGAYEEARSLLK